MSIKHSFFYFIYSKFPFDKKYLSLIVEFIIKLIPNFLLKKNIIIKSDYGIRLKLPLKIIIEWGILFTGRIHPIESNLFYKEYSNNQGNVVQIGGYRDGFFSIIADKISQERNNKNIKIVIVEPVNEFYENLIENLKLNKCFSTMPIKKGIGNENTFTDIYVNEGESSLTEIKNKSFIKERIELITFDKFLDNIGFLPDFLFVDIEKNEYEIVVRAIQLKIKFIFFEILDRDKNNYNMYNNLLINTNYSFYKINRNAELIKLVNLEEFMKSDIFNFVIKHD